MTTSAVAAGVLGQTEVELLPCDVVEGYAMVAGHTD